MTLFAMAAMSVILETYENRVDRNERREQAAIRQAIIDAPVSDWAVYVSVNPVDIDNDSRKPLLMQSKAIIKKPVRMYHDDSLVCRPKSGGEWVLIPGVEDKGDHKRPKIIGLPPMDSMPDAKMVVGRWEYSGRLPQRDSICTMISEPCIEPLPRVIKCLPANESTAIHIIHRDT